MLILDIFYLYTKFDNKIALQRQPFQGAVCGQTECLAKEQEMHDVVF